MIDIAIICYNRSEYILEVLSSISSAKLIENCRVRIYCDGPKSFNDVALIKNVKEQIYLAQEIHKNINLTIDQNQKNIGCWANKIYAFEDSFSKGAKCTLLLEDDVIISKDALVFIEESRQYVDFHEKLMTISLYSSNLETSGRGSINKASNFLKRNYSTFSAWGVRNWPFPWGISLTKRNFEKFKALGWNGHDQTMGKILRENNGFDIFPIIGRSKHIGIKSAIGGQEILIARSFLSDVVCETFNISLDVSINEARKAADSYYVELMNDQGVKNIVLQVYYEDISRFEAFVKRHTGDHEVVGIRVDCEKIIDGNDDYIFSLTEKIYSSSIFIQIEDSFVCNLIKEKIKTHKPFVSFFGEVS